MTSASADFLILGEISTTTKLVLIVEQIISEPNRHPNQFFLGNLIDHGDFHSEE